MLLIEFLKIFKRKFNHIYVLITLLLVFSMQFIETTYYSNSNINKEEFIYNYNLKFILVLIIFFVIVNITYSYRKDYFNRMDKFIRFSKMTRFYNLFSKILANYISALIYYALLIIVYVSLLFFTSQKEVILNVILQNNLILSILMLLFVSNLTLLVVVIFNNSHIAIPISILLLTTLTYIRSFVKNFYNINLIGDVFSDSFSKISSSNVVLEYLISIQLVIYSICIFLISFIVKLIKNN